MKKNEKLTPKQKTFCLEYLKDNNATQAAIRAGYSEKTAREQASRLLSNINIKSEMSKNRAKASKRAEITIDKVVNEIAKIAFSSIAHLHKNWIELSEFEKLTDDQKACIQSIDTKIEKRTNEHGDAVDIHYIKLKLYDKLDALEKLSKHLGLYEIDNKQQQQQVNIVVQNNDIADELKKLSGADD